MLIQPLKLYYRRMAGTFLLVLLALLHVTGVVSLSTLNRLDNAIYDLRLRMTMPRTLDERIVIIDIDEHSLSQIGQWPWNRQQLAELVRELTQHQQVASLGLDTVFAEPDRNSSLTQLQKLAEDELRDDIGFNSWLSRNAASLDHDRALAHELTQGPTVLAYYLTSDRNGYQSGQLPPATVPAQPPPQGMLHWTGYGAAIAPLAEAARGAGFINNLAGTDGLVRAVPLLAAFDGGLYESLSLATLRQAQPRSVLHISRVSALPDAPLRSLQLSGNVLPRPVPLNTDGTVLVPYRGEGGPAGGSFRYISAADVLQGKLPRASLQGRIALLGFTAPGLMDLRATPVSPTYPGVEVHASILSGMLDGRIPYRPDWVPGFQLTLVVILGVIFTLVMPPMRANSAVTLGLGLLLGLLVLNIAAFRLGQIVLPLAAPLMLCLTALGLNLMMGYLFESRARRALAQQFATYVPPELVQQMLRDPTRYNMQARDAELTVMFCDLRNFTTLSETMEPLELQAMLNRLLSDLSHVIRAHQGTIDKYIGDCVMAFWGAPVAEPEHAGKSVAAALEMIETLGRFNAERQAAGLPEVGAGIGLNTGIMSVGNMGSDVRRTYTVIGDAVNLGARLEGLTRRYDVDLVVSESTHASVSALPPGYMWQVLDRVRVKGRRRPVVIYTTRCPSPGQSMDDLQAEIALWNEAFQAWQKRDFLQSQQKVRQLRQWNENLFLYRLYEERIIAILQTPPPADLHGDEAFGVTEF